MPDPSRRWGENVVSATNEETVSSRQGCVFAARCPYAMDICRSTVPPLYKMEERRASSCQLAIQEERTLPVLDGDVTQVFANSERLLNITRSNGAGTVHAPDKTKEGSAQQHA